MKQKNFTVDNNIDFSSFNVSEKSNVVSGYLNTLFNANICNSIITLDIFDQDESQTISLLYDYMMISDAVISYIQKEADKFVLVKNLTNLDEFEKDMTSIILSYANPALLSSRPEILRQMYRLGFRAITIKNDLFVEEYTPTVINQEIINEANHLNMIINCSGFDSPLFDLLADSKLIISNLGSYSICPNPRNITDDDLVKLKERGNLISLSLDDFYLSKSYFQEVTKLREIAAWEIKYLEVEYNFDSPELELKKEQIYRMLENKINDVKSQDISFDEIINHIIHINKLIGTDHIHLATGFGEIIDNENTNYYTLGEIIDILVQKLLSAGFDNDSVGNMLARNMLNFIVRKK